MDQRHHKTENIYGVSARYGSNEELLNGVRLTVAAGYRRFETYSPFPSPGMAQAARYRPTRIQWAVFFGGLAGGIGGFFMQYYAFVIAYPLDIGGRPFNSWPAFVPITFEMTILFAALSGFAALLLGCRLPQVYHPMFNVPGFDRATMDSFFLCIKATDDKFEETEAHLFLKRTNPHDQYTVTQ